MVMRFFQAGSDVQSNAFHGPKARIWDDVVAGRELNGSISVGALDLTIVLWKRYNFSREIRIAWLGACCHVIT